MKRQNIIPYENIGRIIERAGAKRVSSDAKVNLARFLEEEAEKIGLLAVKYSEHAGRNTVLDKDIELADKHLNL